MAKDKTYCANCKVEPRHKGGVYCRECRRLYNKAYVLAHPRNKKLTNGLRKSDKPHVNQAILQSINECERRLIELAEHCKYRIGKISTSQLISLTDDFLNTKNKTHNHEYFFQTTSRDSQG